ncbi:MAG: HNH endonuclease [Chloroflexota bacterium]|nr:HNH endonuclease [Chloroflexota bacterium]
MKYLFQLIIILTIALAISGCSSVTISTGNSGSNQGSSQGGNTTTPRFGVQTKTSGCQAHNALPDSACTPGAIFSTATKAKICVSGYARTVRNVPTSVKDQAYAEYGITHHSTGQYEVDHLVSLELGGSNDIANLWPELASPKPGFHEKDKVENYLHDQVCSGAISLQKAQAEIATNWLGVYNQMGA